MTLICFSHCIAQTNRNFICLEKAKNVDNVLEILKILNILEFQFVFAVSKFCIICILLFFKIRWENTLNLEERDTNQAHKRIECAKKKRKNEKFTDYFCV